MTLSTELQQYLTGRFKGLKLIGPLFYKNIPGLRFDLQNEELSNSTPNGQIEYLLEVNRRIQTISEEVIDENNEIFILYNYYTRRKIKIRKNSYFFKQLKSPSPPHQFKRNSNISSDSKLFRGEKPCQLLIKDKASNINFKNIFRGISHADFLIKPMIKGEVYIINKSTDTIMLMYDDRGCDVISNDIPLLRGYYSKLSDLILEYDRKQIIQKLSIAQENH